MRSSLHPVALLIFLAACGLQTSTESTTPVATAPAAQPGVLGIGLLYRGGRGGLNLNDRKAMPV